MINTSTLVFDIETDSLDVSTANLKWFGAYSYKEDKYFLLDYTNKEEIKELIENHKYIVGFNNKNYDQPITENYLDDDSFQYKIVLDLLQCLAPRGKGDWSYNKNRLNSMNIIPENYKLNTITKLLKLYETEKGEIDYTIFQKDEWNVEERKEIKKYLKQDIILTKKLFEWYESQFSPLTKLMSYDDARKLKHLRATIPSLAYSILCHNADLEPEFETEQPENLKSYSGGHHIDPRWNLVRGNIIEIDFASAYPHAMMMCNLYSPSKEGWNGESYYQVEGTYNNQEQGKIETAINKIFKERLKAKQNNDKPKNLSYKLIINSAYGLTGNWKFKSLYNPTTAADCTHIVRTWMKKLAKTLEEDDFKVLYGFTDSIFVKIPEQSNKEELMFVVNQFLEDAKSNVPFPLDSFKMDIEEEMKMIWFVAKNCYLFVTKDNEVKYKSTLLNKKTPQAVMEVFEKYMKPTIIKTLDVNFTEKELTQALKEVLQLNPTIAAELHSVGDIEDYKVKTSIQYQISEVYGRGKHLLIPNKKGVGIGKAKTTKKKVGVRYCTIEEFNKNKLTFEDIDTSQLIKHFKPFTEASQ